MSKIDTIKFDKHEALVIAHRGLSGIERENTVAAFVAAGNRNYYGIETDVYKTADGKFIVIHDGETNRVADGKYVVEETDFDTLRSLHLKDKRGKIRADLVLPTLSEYFSVCNTYGKVSVLELKSSFSKSELTSIVEIAKENEQLEHTIFISFIFENLTELRSILPEQKLQYLTGDTVDDNMINMLTESQIDLDIYEKCLNQESVNALHNAGITINCFTVDDPKRGEELAKMGVDMITSNILEG